MPIARYGNSRRYIQSLNSFAVLRRLDLSELLTVSELEGADAPYLVAHIETPGGVRLLG